MGGSMGPPHFLLCRWTGALCTAAPKPGLLRRGATDASVRSRSREAGYHPAGDTEGPIGTQRTACAVGWLRSQFFWGAQFFFLHQKVASCEGSAVVLGKVATKLAPKPCPQALVAVWCVGVMQGCVPLGYSLHPETPGTLPARAAQGKSGVLEEDTYAES